MPCRSVFFQHVSLTARSVADWFSVVVCVQLSSFIVLLICIFFSPLCVRTLLCAGDENAVRMRARIVSILCRERHLSATLRTVAFS